MYISQIRVHLDWSSIFDSAKFIEANTRAIFHARTGTQSRVIKITPGGPVTVKEYDAGHGS